MSGYRNSALVMRSARDLLEEMARNKKGILTLREVMGTAGEVHRHRKKVVAKLVRKRHARWENPRRTVAGITPAGRRRLEE